MQFVATTPVSGVLRSEQPVPRLRSPGIQYVALRCLWCQSELTAVPYHSLGQFHSPIECSNCLVKLEQQDGIWLALPEDRQKHFARFICDYETVRKMEGRGSSDSEFYMSLPYYDRTGRNSWQWSIRARTYQHIEQRIIPEVTRSSSRPLSILDLGAGNCWLSYRLASLGQRPIAVDLQSNSYDGLGAAVYYKHSLPTLFPRFQAELDRLPFADSQFDCAIFNASFHYSENYDLTLAETIRCLRPGATIVIADSPSYSREESGLKMVEERRGRFEQQYGTKSDGLTSCEYLTRDRLLSLEAKHDIVWETHQIWYGVRWACRPFFAKLSRRREPSQFRVYTAKVKSA
jgi:SAM-dependent methyltransferase